MSPSVPAVGMPTLDQLQVFLAVAETGSFAAAARQLKRATSAVSYQIDQLELQLGLSLFDRSGTRRPVLTPAGLAMRTEAQGVLRGVGALRARAGGLRTGLEAEVSLVVDVMLPAERLACAARDFQTVFPTVALRLHIESLGAVGQLVLGGVATIGVSGPIRAGGEVLEQRAIGHVELVPVAAPDHPLARSGPLVPGESRDHIQLVLSDRSPLTAGQDFGVLADRTWRIADLSAKHALLRAAIGWGSMPRWMIAGDLASGSLVALDLPEWPSVGYPFHLIHRTDTPPGPAARWLIDRFAAQAEGGESGAYAAAP